MLKRYLKIDLAARQLETALVLFLDRQDTVSVITLAFAADNILSVYLELADPDRASPESIKNPLTTHPWLQEDAFESPRETGPDRGPSDKIERLDTANEHEIPLDLQREAARILDRAVQSYWEVQGELTPRMILFKTMQKDLDV